MSRRARDQSATPARNAGARSQTPLPSLATKQSHAYGAQGKTSLHTQMRASEGDFAEEFTSGRVTRSRAGSARPSEEPEVDSRARSPVTRGGGWQKGGRRQQQAAVIEEVEELAEQPVGAKASQDPSRIPTALTQSAVYQGGNGADGDRAERVRAVQDPSVARTNTRAGVYRAIAFAVFGIMLYAWLPLRGWSQEFRFRQFWGIGMTLGIPGYEKPPGEAEELWFRARHDIMTAEMIPPHNMPEIQWAINRNVLERLGKGETSREQLQSSLGLHEKTLQYLKDILPVTVVLSEDEEKRYEIPPAFFEALGQKIAEGGDAAAPWWDSFISSNEQQLQEVSFRAAERIVGDAVKEKKLVDRDDLVKHLEQMNLDMAARWTQDYRYMWEKHIEIARETARQITEDTMRTFTEDKMIKRQLQVLKNAVDVHNTYEALRTYNWFTFGEGAIINNQLTSATANPAPKGSWLNQFWGKSGPLAFVQNPPVTVLNPWTEVTDCWCASPSHDGSAQISIDMEEEMYPDRLIVEHIPAGGTRNIANAPRTIEVWADAGSEAEAQRLNEVVGQTVPYPDLSQCTKPPTKRHICLGRREYDIHAHNHVQSIEMWTSAKNLGIAVKAFTFRVVNNWGGQRTCLYRLRLVGDELSAQDGFIGYEEQ